MIHKNRKYRAQLITGIESIPFAAANLLVHPFNMLLGPLELREGLPFEVAARWRVLLNSQPQAADWQEALGAFAAASGFFTARGA